MYPYKSSHDVIDKSDGIIRVETKVRMPTTAQKIHADRRTQEKIEVWEQIKKSKYRRIILQGGGKEYEEKTPITLNNIKAPQIDE